MPEGKNKKLIGLMRDDLRGKIRVKFAGLRAKTYSYLIDDCSEDNKAKNTKACAIKRKLKFENYKICLEPTQIITKMHNEFIKNNKLILKTQQL